MSSGPQYSHDGVRDDLTHCTAPPLFYAHVERMIAGTRRNTAPFSLISFSLSDHASSEDVISLAHLILVFMRKEDLCGRLGRFQFIVAFAGDFYDGGELSKRVHEGSSFLFSVHAVQWKVGESLLDMFYRLDRLCEEVG